MECFLLFLTFTVGIVKGDIISLNGLWNVKNSSGDAIPGRVPGGVHTALLSHGVIKDPFYRKNDVDYLWVGRTDWTYYTTFTVSEDFLEKETVLLVCDGLDTISVIFINDKEVGRSVNMFVRYIYDVKQALQVGENTIRVAFTSAVTYGKQKQDELTYNIPPNCPPTVFRGECNGNKIRKMQCAFSWDWGPAFVTQGIWKDIYLQGFNNAVIRDVTTETTKDSDGLWVLKVDVFLEVPADKHGTLSFNLEQTSISESKHVTLSGKNKQVRCSFVVTIPKNILIDAWWPNGYGRQSLYSVAVTFISSDRTEIATRTIKIGFKTLELVQDPVSNKDIHGKTFYFRINGQPVFLKGSNWIPADSFPERVTRERIYNYLKSAADAHMNSLRVWGGGIYESDEFYEIADELGILIWQDFMFACALYPADEAFLQTVSEEITHQIRRLKHHPSLLAYSGNNENEVGMLGGWWPGVSGDRKRYEHDYLKLYIDTIYKVVKQEDPERPFMSSSPSNGIKTEMEGWITRSGNPGATKYGDIHDYQYSRPFYINARYKVPRMASEYGLQSYPSYETLVPVYDSKDMYYDSPLNDHRQHHRNGNNELTNQIEMYLKPPNSTDKLQKFKSIIYCTQIDQAIGMRTETEHYRRWQSEINKGGEGNTMGALYWMLNDIWQAPTWSSLEYDGKWKMLHYYAKRFFAPLLISPYKKEDKFYVYIVIDGIPTSEYLNSEDNTLQFSPKENKESQSTSEGRTSNVPITGDCSYGTECWNRLTWCVLTVCGILLIVNQCYHTYWMSRYWKKLWNYSMFGLLLILVSATVHIMYCTEQSTKFGNHHSANVGDIRPPNLRGNVYIQMFSWDSLERKHTWKIPYKLEKVAQLVHQVPILDVLKEGGCPGPEHCFFILNLGDPIDGPTSWYPLSTFKDARGLRKADLKISEVTVTSTSAEYKIVLTTDVPAPFVWLEAYGIKGRFCDNGFLMYTKTKTVRFYAWETTDLESLKNSLSVKSLMDIYM